MSPPSDRKRKRTAATASSPESAIVIEIPGVPPQVVPTLVHALQQATKCFSNADACLLPCQEPKNDNEPTSYRPMLNPTVLESSDSKHEQEASLMDRVHAAAEAADPAAEAKKKQLERLERMNQAVDSWLSAVQRFTKKKPKSHYEEPVDPFAAPQVQQEAESSNKPAKLPVPLACFLYIWDLEISHKRVAVRRSSLHLLGRLLQKSRDCRAHLFDSQLLIEWIHVVSTARPQDFKGSPEQLSLWQRELYMLVSHLSSSLYSFSELYPTLPVAKQRLVQLIPGVDNAAPADDGPSSAAGMADWRQLRDMALKYGEREIKHVNKLIDRAHDCMDALIPRLGGGETIRNKGASCTTTNQEDSDEDEDDDIEWEDGDEDGVTEIALDSEDHAAAVERTLAAMAASGGIKGGEVDIELGKTEPVAATPRDPAVVVRLEKCIQKLATLHMPRLVAWMQGLSNADNLCKSRTSSALVTLSSEQLRHRGELTPQLASLKQTIASVLSGARRLQIEAPASAESRPALRTSPGGSRNSSLMTSMRKSRRSDKIKINGNRSSNHIQIKYRSS